MSDSADTLGFAFAMDDADAARMAAQIGSSPVLATMGRALGEGVPPGFWATAAAQVGERVQELLQTPLSSVLAQAWSRYTPLLKFCDPHAYPPDRTSVVTLAEHTVKSVHRPRIEVAVSGAPAASIELEIRIAVELDGATVAIRGGRIRELRPGKTIFTGTLSLGEKEIVSRAGVVNLPGRISFGEGIPISPAVPLEKGIAPAPAQQPAGA